MSEKTALITGSGRQRVGNVVAQSLALRGYNVAVHFHSSAKEAEQTVAELRAMGARADAFQANVADENEVDEMFDAVSKTYETLNVLVNTSSIWNTIPFEKTTADDLRKSFDINTLGTFLCSRRAGLMMASQEEGGSIITIGDWAIRRPYLDHAAYFIAKGSIPTMTRMLAVELANRNPKVRVNCIEPGPVMFPPDSSPEEQQSMIDSTLVKNADCPDAISMAVEFLTDNHFVTGTCIPVDGGRSIFTPVQFTEKSI